MISSKIGIHILIIFVLILLLCHVDDDVYRAMIIGAIGGLAAYTLILYRKKPCCGSCGSGGKCESEHDHSHAHEHDERVHHKHHRRPKKSMPVRFEHKLNHRGEGNDFDADYRFYNGDTIKNLYGLTGASGDTRLANRSIWSGTQAKRAMDIRARSDKHSAAKWFTDDELGLSERKCWWEHEVSEIM